MSGVRHWVVVPAAGAGRRMGGAVPKQYLPLRGKTVLEQSLGRFVGHPRIAGVVVVVAADVRWMGIDPALRARVMTAPGGHERSASVRNGLQALAGLAAPDDWVLVHDAARPCLRNADLERLLDALDGDPVGGLLAVPVGDTLKRADAQGTVLETVDRTGVWQAQTPQMFRYRLLHDALASAAAANVSVTDEAMAVERLGQPARLVPGHADNLKITRPEDLALAAFHLERQES